MAFCYKVPFTSVAALVRAKFRNLVSLAFSRPGTDRGTRAGVADATEKAHWRKEHLCFYCRQANHSIHTCPARTPPSSKGHRVESLANTSWPRLRVQPILSLKRALSLRFRSKPQTESISFQRWLIPLPHPVGISAVDSVDISHGIAVL